MSDFNKKTALLSNAAYTNKTPDGFTKNKNLSDRRSKVYEDDDGVYIAFRGTNPSNKSDLLADYSIFNNSLSIAPRFRESKEKLNKVKSFYGDEKPLYVTGHSLGGKQAKNLARNESGITGAYVFNAGTNPYYEAQDSLLDKIGLGKRTDTPIHDFSVSTDPISTGSFVPQRDTTRVNVPRKPGLNSHDMGNFI